MVAAAAPSSDGMAPLISPTPAPMYLDLPETAPTTTISLSSIINWIQQIMSHPETTAATMNVTADDDDNASWPAEAPPSRVVWLWSRILAVASVSNTSWSILWHEWYHLLHWLDWIVLLAVAFLTVPLSRYWYHQRYFAKAAAFHDQASKTSSAVAEDPGCLANGHSEASLSSAATSDTLAAAPPKIQTVSMPAPSASWPPAFEDSHCYQVAWHVSGLARMALLTVLLNALVLLGTVFWSSDETCPAEATCQGRDWGWPLAKIVYTIWITSRFMVLKRHVIYQVWPRYYPVPKIGHLTLLDRWATGLLYLGAYLCLLHLLHMDFILPHFGHSLTAGSAAAAASQHNYGATFVALGSIGTVLVGLAAKDLTATIVSGLVMSMSNRFVEGETVKFENGTIGKVMHLGWVQTTVRNFDNKMEVIPHSKLCTLRVWNISRIHVCQVKQILRFRYADAERLPALLPDLVNEIVAACPTCITDGTRPLRAVWTDYKEDHLRVMVDAHFELPPIGKKYWANRQCVMEAIGRAVRKHDVQFVTSYNITTHALGAPPPPDKSEYYG
jgi:Mechanosensitive ion channel